VPEGTKPNWNEIVRERLRLPSSAQEAIPEIAAHLEEAYDDAVAEGLTAPAAIEMTLQQIGDWRALRNSICRAKCKELPMNPRTKTLWLPAIAILFAAGLVLLLLDPAAFLQRLTWIACMALLLCATASERNHLNLRTTSLWLPGFVSLTAASLLMFAEEIAFSHDPSFYFTDLSLRPNHLIFGLPGLFYAMWLLIQVPCGALGAVLSRRGGGTRAARVVAGAFPAIVMFGLCAVAIPVSALFERDSYVRHHPASVALAVCVWAGVPAIALLMGAAPFLRRADSSVKATA
jgi:hypothetical protein